MVLLDQSRTLRYRGRIDDQLRIGGSKPTASRNDLEEAIREVLAGKSVSIAETAVKTDVKLLPQFVVLREVTLPGQKMWPRLSFEVFRLSSSGNGSSIFSADV